MITTKPEIITIDWTAYYQLCSQVLWKIEESNQKYHFIIAITRGGFYLGDYLSRYLNIPLGTIAAASYQGQEQKQLTIGYLSITVKHKKPWEQKVLLVDDIIDSSKTIRGVRDRLNCAYDLINIDTACIWQKPQSNFIANYFARDNETRWIVQPFENGIN